jgi:hypothetical protein
MENDMSFDRKQFRDLIEDTLNRADQIYAEAGGKGYKFYSPQAVELLMMTAAQESLLGTYLKQIKGPAVSVFQIEKRTLGDLLEWIASTSLALSAVVGAFSFSGTDLLVEEEIVGNLCLAIVMARIYYMRVKEPLPTSVNDMAKYYKKYYNTHLGAATVEGTLNNYKKLAV